MLLFDSRLQRWKICMPDENRLPDESSVALPDLLQHSREFRGDQVLYRFGNGLQILLGATMLGPAISRSQLIQQLGDLSVEPGSVLLVHTSFSKMRPVEDGPQGLIAASRLALGPEGTLVMPSMTEDDDHAFDPETTPWIDMGIVADMFWGLAGVFRRDNPSAFAAVGKQATRITAPHPIDPPHGLDSSVGRVYELDGRCFCLASVTMPTRPFIWPSR
jgi:hypothetical protein